MAVRPGGKILLAGSETIKERLLVTRLHATGSPGRSFDGGDGRELIGFGDEETLEAMGIQSRGKIVVTNQVQPGSRFKPSIGLPRLRGNPAPAISGALTHDPNDPRDAIESEMTREYALVN